MVMKKSGTETALPTCLTKAWHSEPPGQTLLTLETGTAKYSVIDSRAVFQMANGPVMYVAAFARDAADEVHSFTVGLHIYLNLDSDSKSTTPLEST